VGVSSESPPAQRLHQAMLAEGRPLIKRGLPRSSQSSEPGVLREKSCKTRGKRQVVGWEGQGFGSRGGTEGERGSGESGGKGGGSCEAEGGEGGKGKGGEEGVQDHLMTQRFRCRASDLYDGVLMDDKRGWPSLTPRRRSAGMSGARSRSSMAPSQGQMRSWRPTL